MIIKKEGAINEIVYEYTTYRSGKYRLYPTVTDLNNIIDKIIESKSTTDYIRVTPFYMNEKLNMQIEFEEYMFYIECREEFEDKEIENHIVDCLSAHHEIITAEEIVMGKILFPLCKYRDVEHFGFSLKRYRQYLDELLPILFQRSKEDMKLKDDDLAFGYFCFEVHSG